MTRVTGQQARELLDGTTSGPWRVEVHKRHDIIAQPGGHAIAYNEDEPEIGRGNSHLLAAAPDLAETVAWLYGRKADGHYGKRQWPLGGKWEVALWRGLIAIGPEGGGIAFRTPELTEEAARALLAAVEEHRRDHR